MNLLLGNEQKSVVFLSFLSLLTVMQLSVGYVISYKMP